MKAKNIATTLAALMLAILVLIKCKQEPEVLINQEFEMNPPLAENIVVKKIDGNKTGNLLVVADLGKRLKDNSLAIQLSTGKVILHDDGRNGDEMKGDGKFSIILKEDLELITSEFETFEKNKEAFSQEVNFKGRQVVSLRDKELLNKFSAEKFRKGGEQLLSKNLLCKMITDVSQDHSLLITNLGTVEDSTRTAKPCNPLWPINGAWTFQKLVSDMANTTSTGVNPEAFVKSWLNSWLATTSVNSETINKRDLLFSTVIEPWVIKSGSASGSFNITNWQTKPLDLAKAPFKLIAIINRLDLRGNMGYGVSNSGEGRFIFEVLNSSCAPITGQFTVIFEYGIPVHNCKDLKAYGKKWYDLKNLALGSEAYNSALQEITEVFTAANAAPSKPNGSALNQIRTNERAIGAPWELREFNIDSATHHLFLTTVKQEPAEKYNEASPIASAPDVSELTIWINANESLILADKHTVPLTIMAGSPPASKPFLGGRAHSEPGKWKAPSVAIETRHHFSLSTCSGCHRQETQTSFVHFSTVPFGVQSIPSGFLTGIDANDPEDPSVVHSFNDVQLRKNKMKDLLCNTCNGGFRELLSILTFDPIRMEH